MSRHAFKVGDLVVFTKEKCSFRPGPRAHDLHPAPRGESYTYRVDKFWIVVGCLDEGRRLLLATRRGKQHLVEATSPHLRPATIWQRIRHRGRFPSAEVLAEQAQNLASRNADGSVTNNHPV